MNLKNGNKKAQNAIREKKAIISEKTAKKTKKNTHGATNKSA